MWCVWSVDDYPGPWLWTQIWPRSDSGLRRRRGNGQNVKKAIVKDLCMECRHFVCSRSAVDGNPPQIILKQQRQFSHRNKVRKWPVWLKENCEGIVHVMQTLCVFQVSCWWELSSNHSQTTKAVFSSNQSQETVRMAKRPLWRNCAWNADTLYAPGQLLMESFLKTYSSSC